MIQLSTSLIVLAMLLLTAQARAADTLMGEIAKDGGGLRLSRSEMISTPETASIDIGGQTAHGELPVGVLGAEISMMDGTIQQIFPGSDLGRMGVTIGDRIITINGHHWTNRSIYDDCRGDPGTYIDMMIIHQSRPFNIQVMRTDCRQFLNYDYFGIRPGYYHWCAARTQRW
jgi:hypothetical protein